MRVARQRRKKRMALRHKARARLGLARLQRPRMDVEEVAAFQVAAMAVLGVEAVVTARLVQLLNPTDTAVGIMLVVKEV